MIAAILGSPEYLARLAQLGATIDWGDGTRSPGTIATAAGGGFSVSGTHTYTRAQPFVIMVKVTDAGGSSATARSPAVVRSRR